MKKQQPKWLITEELAEEVSQSLWAAYYIHPGVNARLAHENSFVDGCKCGLAYGVLTNKERLTRLHLIISLLIGLSAGLGLVLALSHFRH